MRARERWRPRFLGTRGESEEALDRLYDFFGFADAERRAVLELSLEGQRVRLAVDRKPRQRNNTIALRRPLVGTHLSVFFEGAEPPREGLFDLGEEGPRVELRLERQRDLTAKERGLVREIQTGFPEFDDAVFIEDHATEEDVLRVLSKPATRAAVLDLLDLGLAKVTLTRHAAQIFLRTEDPDQLDEQRILEALEVLLVVGKAGGLRADAPARRGDNAIPLFAALAAAMLGYAFLVWNLWSTSPLPLVPGLIAAAVLWLAARPLAEKMTAGDGASERKSLSLLLAWSVASSMALTAALIHVNGGLDDAEPETWHGVVTQMHSHQRRSFWRSSTTADVRWSDGSSENINASGFDKRGHRVTQIRHPGALGIEWRESALITTR